MADQIARMIGDDPSGPGGGLEAPPWLENVSIQVDANPTAVNYGQSTVVSWSVDLPTGGPPPQVRLNGELVARSGSRSFSPSRRSSYSVIVSGTQLGVHAQTSGSVDVEVRYPPRVVIDPSTPSPVQVLLGALVESTNQPQTVELCNVELDLTGHQSIAIGDHRTLIASPGCERGPRRLGPRIFVTDTRGRVPLFVIEGDNVRFSGFRLEGPTTGIGKGDRKEKGIVIAPAKSAEPIRRIEISNMEIFHWSGVGVQVTDNVEKAVRGRLFNTNPNAVGIRGNFFHHNRHGAGEGYGVAVTLGAYATIEQNVFDENRHGIAGGSNHPDALDYSGYTVRDNLILEGGGKHCMDRPGTGAIVGGLIGGLIGGLVGLAVGGPWGALIGGVIGTGVGGVIGSQAGTICWQTHQIDMHGDGNQWPGSHNWQCGTAGETMIIERNTVLYTGGHTLFFQNGLAIKIRGNPADKAIIDGNVFKHKSRGDAIAQNGACGGDITRPIDVRPNNQFGVDPMTELGSGDFAGDGQMDQFMATGVTWWAKSPVTHQWRYLNTMSERLPQLLLQKVDSDGVFDVALRPPRRGMPPTTYSKSGTGPWVPVPTTAGGPGSPILES
ncbi:MAG: hypothetical protein H7Y88_10805 [Phycisphaerales bacterium]|nr:hypothetical protein [Phycisphaerales bacterium]